MGIEAFSPAVREWFASSFPAPTPAHAQIGNALLDQRVAAGVGNVYKSEVLFACGVDPFRPVGALSPVLRRRLFETAARLLRANLDSGARTTVEGGLAVYGRAGRPCRSCGTTIERRRQGEAGRATYWCPASQPGGGADDPVSRPSSRRR